MLAMMMLHVIKAVRPIDFTVDLVGRKIGREQMPDQLSFRLGMQNRHTVKHAAVTRLSPTFGIKRGPVERDGGHAVAHPALYYMAVEGTQVGVVII